jgi:phosphoenolpyruvate synthase/pyruvate phosphate dikinase
MNTSLILPLENQALLKNIGGKAFSLGKLITAGFDVPEGFVITTAAFQKMTSDLEAEVLKSFDTLNADFVAVRSSATAEDGINDAWAGQLDTFLNVTRDDLIKHIRSCWDSIGSDRAKAYAAQKLLTSGNVGVIVQRMVQSDVSGVAFSTHPVTKNSDQIIIEAGLGLGEAIVSGQITPDTFITDKSTHRILEKHVSNQVKKLAQDKDGQTNWIQIDGSGPKLADVEVSELSRIVLRLEQYFGYAVDVEWGLSDGHFYILQSRPITTL